jgi:hypothetical protein
LLESPPAHRAASGTAWATVIEPLLLDYAEADISAAMTWAVNEDSFWPKFLFGRPEPAEYLAEKAETIIARWRGATRSKRPSVSTPTTTPTRRVVDDGLLNYI